jgi:hypothetical protein
MNNFYLMGDVHIKVDKKQLINQLKALSDKFVDLHFNTKDLSWLAVADSKNYNRMNTKN